MPYAAGLSLTVLLSDGMSAIRALAKNMVRPDRHIRPGSSGENRTYLSAATVAPATVSGGVVRWRARPFPPRNQNNHTEERQHVERERRADTGDGDNHASQRRADCTRRH